MSFYYPLGLLGLLGIPVLILIYIIKSKYTEQTIASTYLWQLSEKFLKKRKPISKLTGIITLILQILAVIIVSLLIAHPVFTVPASANEFYFIVDGSASMNMQSDGVTRFEKAKQKINDIIDDSHGGSSYTLVLVGDNTSVVFEAVTDKEQAKSNVSSLAAGWSAADCASAVSYAQDYFDEHSSAVMYLFTDKKYETSNHITLLDMSSGEKNCAFRDYGYKYTDTGVCGTGSVISYSEDGALTVEMWVAEDKDNAKMVAQTSVNVKTGVAAQFELQADLSQFFSLQLRIANGDAMIEDNIVTLYDEAKAQERKVLVVTDNNDGVYLLNSIRSAGKATAEIMSTKAYATSGADGYGLYVFSGYTPASLPKNAAVWLFNAIDGIGKDSGVTFRDVQIPRDEVGPNSYYVPQYTAGSSALERLLTKDLVKRDVAIRKYARYGVPRSFTSLMKVGGDSVAFAGLNENNNREVVFAFELGDSNFAMQEDFLILVRNLMNYSFPSVIEDTVFVCGDTAAVNVVPGCENIVLTSPSGKSTTLDTLGADICEVMLVETGTYKFNVKIAGRDDFDVYAFSCVPEAESLPSEGGAIILSGEQTHDYSDGFYDKLLPFFIVIALLLLADWGVYCYEQYQLR